MTEQDFVINRLTADYRIKPFDCGDDDLNDFLLQDAKLYLQEHLSVTYLIENETETIGYYAVQNDKISLEDFPSNNQFNKARKNIPRGKMHKSYPAVKVGRLAISAGHSGKGIGPDILDYLKVLFITNNRTGCRFMLVDAYTSRVDWCQKMDFKLLKSRDDSQRTQLMYFDLKQIR